MSPKSLEALEEMKRRGYDSATIAAEKERLQRFEDGLELIPIIEAAFVDVVLGNGVGLYEAQGLDDYKSKAECAALRINDEKLDWSRISSKDLCTCNSSLSFFDAEGLRFHLPAYLICELKGEYGFGVIYALTFPILHTETEDKFTLLSREQRIAVRLFLQHMLHDPDCERDRPDMERALNEYWVWPTDA